MKALEKIANIKCADDHNLVAEMVKMGSTQLHRRILDAFNKCLDEGEFDHEWHVTVFQMLLKQVG